MARPPKIQGRRKRLDACVSASYQLFMDDLHPTIRGTLEGKGDFKWRSDALLFFSMRKDIGLVGGWIYPGALGRRSAVLTSLF